MGGTLWQQGGKHQGHSPLDVVDDLKQPNRNAPKAATICWSLRGMTPFRSHLLLPYHSRILPVSQFQSNKNSLKQDHVDPILAAILNPLGLVTVILRVLTVLLQVLIGCCMFLLILSTGLHSYGWQKPFGFDAKRGAFYWISWYKKEAGYSLVALWPGLSSTL